MATTRLTFGSILGTVSTAANTVTGAFDAASKGIGMIDVYVSEAAERQRLRSVADQASFIDELIIEKSQEEAQRGIQVIQFCKASNDHLKLFEKSHDKYSKLLSPKAE